MNFIKTNKFIDSFEVELKFAENAANGFSFEPPKGLHCVLAHTLVKHYKLYLNVINRALVVPGLISEKIDIYSNQR